ncbi:hypothetical protein GDO86_014860 [Hymenochirus boettgeri]|uniref:Endosome-associated-trafficking regulator 1 n=1 Tax=Hymenochirus boettgeri TaxID=247094 RepID=A0A8T2JVJ3_9PIPI|nr:hypothetical protein GDO86_014860 [Hymenochirus boettgeri]
MAGFSKQPNGKGKTLIIEDDCETEDQGNSNPFSFKEFVKIKSDSGVTSSNCDRALSKDTKKSTFPFTEPSECFGRTLEFQETFFKEPTLYDDLQEEEEDYWSGSYHPSVIEHAHIAKDYSPGSSYGESYGHSAGDASCDGLFTEWQQACVAAPTAGLYIKSENYLSNTKNSEEDVRIHTLRISCEELQEENDHLKSKICELQEQNENQSKTVKYLERKLEEKILEEQKEAQDLESMVQQVEKNLEMMTKRAAKAEGSVNKLKQEVALLQIQLSTYKAENESLRLGETAGMNAVKQNANLALENIHKVVIGAQSSIKQLLSGAESLNLVADLLRSIDKIAEIHNDDVP